MSSSLKFAVGFSFVFITAYGLSVLFNWTVAALIMVSLSPILVIWLAVKTLKDPNPSNNTFEDRFYEDLDYQRNH